MLNSKEFVRELQLRHESAWMNPNVGSTETALAALPLTRTDVDDAEARLERFAPFIKKVFPETAADRGLIESPLTEIENMRAWLNENEGAQLAGKLFFCLFIKYLCLFDFLRYLRIFSINKLK